MKILYLDQNKWIDLARALNYPTAKPAHALALEKIKRAVQSSKVLVPLTASNIYETQKINEFSRREVMAKLQAALSNGNVFQCGSFRLRYELTKLLLEQSGKTKNGQHDRWFLSDFFLDAFAERKDLKNENGFEFAFSFNQANPRAAINSFLFDIPIEARKTTVKNYSQSSVELIRQIERRKLLAEGLSAKKHGDVYRAQLLLDHLEQILSIANEIGIPWRSVLDIGDVMARRIISDLPYFSVETELAIKLERSNHTLIENDLRDMQNMSAVLPHSSFVVIEKAFAALAIQSKLHQKFGVKIMTDISELNEIL